MSARREALRCWVDARLRAAGTGAIRPPAPLPVEASFRSFERIACTDGRSVIAIDAPPERENNAQYCRIAEHWRRAGLAVPEVLANDLERGFLLVTDLGADTVDDHLCDETADVIYARALEQLHTIQQLPVDTTLYPDYSAERLDAEIDVFAQWLLAPLAGVSPAPLDAVRRLLVDSARAQPQVVIHLDWHSRNLIHTPDGQFGIVDFQDARIGPYTYDVVSLLRDCYQRFDEAHVSRWSTLYRNHLAARSLAGPEFQREFDWMGIQRHLKAAGIFMRMSARDGKPQHLPHVRPTLARVIEVGSRYPELAGLVRWLQADVLPALHPLLPLLPLLPEEPSACA